MKRERLWQKTVKRFLDKLKPSIVTSPQILAYLKEAGHRVNPGQLGIFMRKLEFRGEQKTRQGVRLREYSRLTKPTVKVIGFKCYYPECGWNGFYRLQGSERIREDDRRVIMNDSGEERLAVCPRCHPPDQLLRPGWAVKYVYFYKHGFVRKDGQVRFYDEYIRERVERGFPLEAGYHGPGQLGEVSDFESPW